MLRPKGLHPHLGITRKPSRSLSRIPSYRMWTSLVWLPLRHPKGFLQPSLPWTIGQCLLVYALGLCRRALGSPPSQKPAAAQEVISQGQSPWRSVDQADLDPGDPSPYSVRDWPFWPCYNLGLSSFGSSLLDPILSL